MEKSVKEIFTFICFFFPVKSIINISCVLSYYKYLGSKSHQQTLSIYIYVYIFVSIAYRCCLQAV